MKYKYLDVLPRGFSTSFELTAFQFQVQVISHVTRHYHVGEAELLRQADVLEEQRVLLANLRQLAVQHAQRDHYAVVRLARQRGALVVADDLLVQLMKLLFLSLAHLETMLLIITQRACSTLYSLP